MLWPLIMVSRTSMRAVARPGAMFSSWMPRWREARSASYMAAAERWARAWGSSGTRPPGLGCARAGWQTWAVSVGMAGGLGWCRAAGGPSGGAVTGRGERDGATGDRIRAPGRGPRPGGGRRAGGADLGGLPGARPAAGRGAEGGRGADGRPDAGPDHPAPGRFHRDLVVRVGDPDLRSGAAAQGPRP